MAKSLTELKNSTKAPAAAAAPAASAAPVEKPKKTKKADKEKMSPEDLKAMRLKNLKPKIKDPAKAEREGVIKAHITRILTANPTGVTASSLREEIFPGIAEDQIKATEKEIRFIARAMKCTRTQVEGSRRVLYVLPVA